MSNVIFVVSSGWYKSAFPRNERIPFFIMRLMAKKGEAKFFAVESNDGKFGGFAVTMKHGDIVILSYFAIHPKLRNRGIGSKALKALMKHYSGYRFILEIEDAKEPCADRETRLRRRAFYLANGMKSAGFTAHVFETDLEVLTAGKPVSFEEYRDLYRVRRGIRVTLNVTLKRLIEDQISEE